MAERLTRMVCKETFDDRGFRWKKGDIALVSLEKKAILIGKDKHTETFKAITDENFNKLEEEK